GVSFLLLPLLAHPSTRLYFPFHHPPSPASSTLSLHDALPIWLARARMLSGRGHATLREGASHRSNFMLWTAVDTWISSVLRLRSDRKSTRLNSSHGSISYAVFCLKKKKSLNECYRFVHEANEC